MAFLGAIGASNNLMKIGKPVNRLNWWMFDIDNIQLISLTTVPDNVSDSKSVTYIELSAPGEKYRPMLYSGLGNKKITFSLRVIARNQVIGNTIYTRQFDALRQPKVGLLNIFATDEAFTPNPRVLYHYGTGTSIPLIYFVTRCDMSHSLYNNWGYPQVTDVDIELTLDESHFINIAEDLARKISMALGTIQSAGSLIANLAGERRKPY